MMRVERLSNRHDVSAFDSGSKPLDDWLRQHALENSRRNLSRTFVLIDDAEVVCGYYSLAMGGVRKEALPRKLGRGLPAYDIGMVLLARLAIQRERQGHGYGRDLVIAAVEEAAAAGHHAAARFIAVDPIDEQARRFYAKFGFKDVPDDPAGRMFMRIDEAIATFSETT